MPKTSRFLSAILVFSLALNLLTLASPLFMMQVYDRVMVSHSLPTLAALLILVCALQAAQGLLHLLRARVLRRFADYVDEVCEEAAFVETTEPQTAKASGQLNDTPLQALSDVRTFITGNGLSSLFDLPWVVVFALIMFLLHHWLGFLALAFAVAIAGCSLTAQILKNKQPSLNDTASAFRDPFRDAARKQTIKGLGLSEHFRERWIDARHNGRQEKRLSQRWSDLFQTFARILRNIQSSVILGFAAYLTLENAATFGVMMASSIIAGRISAPLDGVINSWKDIKAAQVGWPRLQEIVKNYHPDAGSDRQQLPPSSSLTLQNVSAGPPGRLNDRSLVGATIAVNAGDIIGVIGSSGSGKSTLINVLAGAWPLRAGKVRFDDVERKRWDRRVLSSAIGYLPQDPVFFDGTIAENIARFAVDVEEEEMMDAARAAGIHEIIDAFPDGYDTIVQNAGRNFPPGFRTKLGLARAYYGEPFLLLIDNPTAHFDHDGEVRLAEQLNLHRTRGGIAILATSHSAALMMVEKVIVMNAGKIASFGSREDLFKPTGNASEKRIQPKVVSLPIAANAHDGG